MGEVYAAEHVETAQPAAVKLLQSARVDSASIWSSASCARARSRASQQPVPGARPRRRTARDGAPYMAMELLVGTTWPPLAQGRPSAGADVADLARALGEGLRTRTTPASSTATSSRSTSSNAEQDRRAALEDPRFRHLEAARRRPARSPRSRSSARPATCRRSKRAAAGRSRSDLFSMAAVLYRAMTGRPASSATNAADHVRHRLQDAGAAVVDREALPSDVDLVLAIALAKDRGSRWQSAGELAVAFAQATAPARRELRARGQAVVAAHPWGEIVRIARRWCGRTRKRVRAAGRSRIARTAEARGRQPASGGVVRGSPVEHVDHVRPRLRSRIDRFGRAGRDSSAHGDGHFLRARIRIARGTVRITLPGGFGAASVVAERN